MTECRRPRFFSPDFFCGFGGVGLAFGYIAARGSFGMVTVNTPFLNAAEILS
mgnify:CR=1 FL=1